MTHEFEIPSSKEPFDWNEFVTKVPSHATLRGSFIQDLLDDINGVGQAPPPNLRSKYIAFATYPMTDYIVALRAACSLVHPRRSVREAMKAYGRQNYPRFASSLIGKTIFAAAGDFDNIVRVAGKAYEVVVPGCTSKITGQGAGYAVVELRDCWAINDPVQVGTWEGAMDVAKVRGQVKIRRHSLCDADIELAWQVH